MAEFILKDRYGKDRSFDKETIFVKGVDGELMQFTHGTGNPVIESLEITENGTYTAPEGVDGYNPVVVEVPAPEIKLQDKTITENGEYTADSGFDGLGKVTVEVAGSGGGSLPAGLYFENDVDNFMSPYTYYQRCVVFNDTVYVIGLTSSKNGLMFYKYANGAWTNVATYNMSGNTNFPAFCPIVYNGKIHICGIHGRTDHISYDDENGVIAHNSVPKAPSDCGTNSGFVDNGVLKYAAIGGYLYAWDESADTWSQETKVSAYYPGFFQWNGNAYYCGDGAIYKYSNGASIKKMTVARSDFLSTNVAVNGDCFYYKEGTNTTSPSIYKLNMATLEETCIGKLPAGLQNSYYYNFLYYDGKLRYFGSSGNHTSLILHEVTE